MGFRIEKNVFSSYIDLVKRICIVTSVWTIRSILKWVTPEINLVEIIQRISLIERHIIWGDLPI